MASQNRTHASDRGKAIPDLPGVPTIGTATAGAGLATVAFTASAVGGLSTSYTALSSPGSITGTGTSSPITVSSLTPGTAYTFTVRGVNTTGNGDYSSASNSVTPTAVNAYESIATVTVGSGGSSTVSFSSIPSTYKHLQVRFIAQSSRATYGTDNCLIRVGNSSIDTASNYSYHGVAADGAAASAFGSASVTQFIAQISASGASSIYGGVVMDILEYANTNTYKTSRILSGADHNGAIAGYYGQIIYSSSNWRNTSAVTTIQFRPEFGSTFTQYSSFALYGIKGA